MKKLRYRKVEYLAKLPMVEPELKFWEFDSESLSSATTLYLPLPLSVPKSFVQKINSTENIMFFLSLHADIAIEIWHGRYFRSLL